MKVAVRRKHWGSLEVFHELDANGDLKCHFSDRGMKFRTVEREDLPEHVERCANCAGEAYAKNTHDGQSWAAKLRAADDPEEVLGR